MPDQPIIFSRPMTRRPVLRYHGGKWNLAPWIIGHFPHHRTYVEPYGGAASVLIRKRRSYAEIYNDLDQDVVNLFKVLRSMAASDLVDQLRLTPFSRADFTDAKIISHDPVERARRLVVRSFMGFGSNGHSKSTGFRANSNRSGSTPAHDWENYPDCLLDIIVRLSGVVIENRPAVDVMAQHDSADTLHYVDPPYLPETRGKGGDYAHELTVDDHRDLLAFLQTLKGKVVLSGYPHDLYNTALKSWHRVTRLALADGARKRTEVLWMNFEPAQSELLLEAAQ